MVTKTKFHFITVVPICSVAIFGELFLHYHNCELRVFLESQFIEAQISSAISIVNSNAIIKYAFGLKTEKF